MDPLTLELEQILSESPASVAAREATTFDTLAAPYPRSLVLFGAGNLGRKALAGLRKVGIEPVAFADNDERQWGRVIEGLTVLSPREAIEKHDATSTFVMTIWRGEGTDRMPDRVAALRALGATRVVPFPSLFWKHAAEFLPHYAMGLPHRLTRQAEQIKAAFALFEDEASRREFLAQIRWRMLLDFDSLPDPVAHEIYFPDDLFALRDDEVFVDCGAFDGDTLRRFFVHRPDFRGQIHTFEPDPANFVKLQAYVASLPEERRQRVHARPYAVSDKRERVRFSGTGTEAASVGVGPIEVEAAPLDEILAGAAPTYLKMDIEGSELDALAGAQQILRTHAPALAICVYHRQDHLWRVPLRVREHSDRYRYFLRPHLLEVWDLVMYAVPVDRLATRT